MRSAFVVVVIVASALAASTGCRKPPSLPLLRAGVVRESIGMKGLHPGQKCAVRITSDARAGFNCHITLLCEGTTLYGGALPGGYADCGGTADRTTKASDPMPSSEDGDPAVDVDLVRGEAVYRDDRPERRVVVTLDPE
jgi:hypothetical protein